MSGPCQETPSIDALMSHPMRNWMKAFLDDATTTRQRIWRWSHGTKYSGTLCTVIALCCVLKGVFGSRNLNDTSMSFMDAATMIAATPYQFFWSAHRGHTRQIMARLVWAAENLERGASEREKDDLRATASQIQLFCSTLFFASLGTTTVMVLFPVLTGSLTMKVWPTPQGPWLVIVQIAQIAAFVPSGCGISAYMSVLLMMAVGAASLCRVLALRLESIRGQAALLEFVRLHQAVIDVCDALVEMFSFVLFVSIFGFLSVSLFGTFNVVCGNFAPYTIGIVPSSFLFFFMVTVISDALQDSSSRVGEAAWNMPWTEEPVLARRLVLMVLVRTRKPAALRAKLLGAISLSLFMDTMKIWWSQLQMMRSLVK